MTRYNTSMLITKGRNWISIEKGKLQCEFICQRVNAIQALPNEMQEFGMKKEDFNESLVAKMSKEPQPSLKGLIRHDHFGQLADIEDLMEEINDVEESNDVPEPTNEDDFWSI